MSLPGYHLGALIQLWSNVEIEVVSVNKLGLMMFDMSPQGQKVRPGQMYIFVKVFPSEHLEQLHMEPNK